MSLCVSLLGFVVAVGFLQSVNAQSSCQGQDSSHLNPRDFHKQRHSIGNAMENAYNNGECFCMTTYNHRYHCKQSQSCRRTDHIASFIHQLQHAEYYGDTTLMKKVLNLIENNAKSLHFKDQWEAILRASWLTGGILGEVNREKMCVMADMIDTGVEAENSLRDSDEWICTFEEFKYSLLDALYSVMKNTLSEQGCPTVGVPNIRPPPCFKLKACTDDGRKYQIGEYWEEYGGFLTEIEKSGKDVNDCPLLESIARELYEAKDLKANYLGAIITGTAMAADWVWKADIEQTDAMYNSIKSMGIFQEAITTVKKCPCDQLQDSLLKKLEHYGGTVDVIFDIFNGKLSKMEAGHVSKWKNHHGHSHSRRH